MNSLVEKLEHARDRYLSMSFERIGLNEAISIVRSHEAEARKGAEQKADYMPFKPGDTHCEDCPCRYGQHIRNPKQESGEYGYAIFDGDSLRVMDYRIHAYWHKSQALAKCPKSFQVKRVLITPVSETEGEQP